MSEKAQFILGEAAGVGLMRTVGATDEQIQEALLAARMTRNYLEAEDTLRARLASAAVPEAETQAAIVAMQENHERVVGVLESPIERLLLPWLIAMPCLRLHQKIARTVLVSDDDRPRDCDTRIVPQMPFGRHRLDFAVVTRVATRTLILAVECDGREFHRLPDDAARDRYLASFGIDTLRFPGPEINAHPDYVALCVADAVASWLDRTSVAAK